MHTLFETDDLVKRRAEILQKGVDALERNDMYRVRIYERLADNLNEEIIRRLR